MSEPFDQDERPVADDWSDGEVSLDGEKELLEPEGDGPMAHPVSVLPGLRVCSLARPCSSSQPQPFTR